MIHLHRFDERKVAPMSFFGNSTPALPAAPADPPALDDPSVRAAREAEFRANLLRRGRASTISAGAADLSDVGVQKKTLLGQ